MFGSRRQIKGKISYLKDYVTSDSWELLIIRWKYIQETRVKGRTLSDILKMIQLQNLLNLIWGSIRKEMLKFCRDDRKFESEYCRVIGVFLRTKNGFEYFLTSHSLALKSLALKSWPPNKRPNPVPSSSSSPESSATFATMMIVISRWSKSEGNVGLQTDLFHLIARPRRNLWQIYLWINHDPMSEWIMKSKLHNVGLKSNFKMITYHRYAERMLKWMEIPGLILASLMLRYYE